MFRDRFKIFPVAQPPSAVRPTGGADGRGSLHSRGRLCHKEPHLRERLRREALEMRPAFSETLHRRIMSAVERRVGDESSSRLDPRPAAVHRRRKRSLVAVAAAACLLCAAAVGWRLREGYLRSADGVAPSPMADLALIGELTDIAAVGLDGLVGSVELTPPPARLSSDARLTAEVLIERLPVDVELASE
jgi:hypothetical protein